VVRWAPLAPAAREIPLPGWLRLWLLFAVVWRVAYHLRYLGEDPFAFAPISDGSVYETMALDIRAHPPWGSEPFYLQGAYGAFLALGLSIRGEPSVAILLQLGMMAIAWWGFFRAVAVVTDRRAAGIATAILLAVPALWFYENKYLTAALSCASLVAMLGALAAVLRRPTTLRIALAGAAAGIAILFRGNLVLAVPLCAWAVVGFVREEARPAGPTWPRALAAYAVGLVLALSPMAVRNAIVTGSATVLPAHGGGTSFYIGNNAEARGVWNDASGLLSGDVRQEAGELAERLGVEADGDAARARAIGRALYGRAVQEIAEDPGAWVWLELRKAWLMLGNDELAQDYDLFGEREILGRAVHLGLPFGILFALFAAAWVGARGRPRDAIGRAWTRTCGGQALAVVAANLLFFTSAQHRLPLVVPLVAWVAWARPDLAFAAADRRRRIAMVVAAVLAFAFSAIPPRSRQTEPSAVHDYNLSLALLRIGDPRGALASLDRAVERRPEHPVIRLERATRAREIGELETARADLAVLDEMSDLPPWVRARIADEHQWLDALDPRPGKPTDMSSR
jgi:hypothetical protein